MAAKSGHTNSKDDVDANISPVNSSSACFYSKDCRSLGFLVSILMLCAVVNIF